VSAGSPGSDVPRKPGWLDELATAGRENLDPDHASQHDRKEDARAAEEVQLLVDLGLDQSKDVVDLGAGTLSSLWLAGAVSPGRMFFGPPPTIGTNVRVR
jgi:hypothetical protein